MVKSKKGKKEIIAEEMDSDVEVQNTSRITKEKTTDKALKTETDDAEDDVEQISKKVKKINLSKVNKPTKASVKSYSESSDNSKDDEFTEKAQSSKKKSKKGAVKAGFDLLMLDEDDDDNEVQNEVASFPKAISDAEEEGEEDIPKPMNKKNQAKAKKGKEQKRKKSEDEDIDKILAELKTEYQEAEKDVSEDVKGQKDKKKTVEKKLDKNEDTAEGGNEETSVKSAAQKKKEKKERQKREAALAKQKTGEKSIVASKEKVEEIIAEPETATLSRQLSNNESIPESIEDKQEEDEDAIKKDENKNKKNKKDKAKKGVKEEEKKDDKKKGVSKAMVAAMQERLRKIKEEEERMEREQEERIKMEEEREKQRLEQLKLEEEKKEKRKQKEADRKARLKAEGKLLTKKQKDDRARAQAMLEALKAQGLELPDPADKRPRPGTRLRPNKKKINKQDSDENKQEGDEETPTEQSKDETLVPEEHVEVVKEAWDASSDSEEEDDSKSNDVQSTSQKAPKTKLQSDSKQQKSKKKDESESEDESSGEESNEDESEEEDEEKHVSNDPEAKRERAVARIQKRQVEADKLRTTDNLRAAVVCVLGHVDTGKTKILDKLRRTHVQDSEAGGITQQIGATNVPIDAIKEQVKIVRNSNEFVFKLPGLLIIDTPGHESFSNLRNRGSSLCDIAILVVDIMHGLEPQTIESINLLKAKKTPFLVALNKIDRLYDWETMPRKDCREIIKGQLANTQFEFSQRTKEIILQFAEQGLNAALFYENPDPRTYISMVPTSAITGEGMGNLLYLIVEVCQNMLAKRLMYSESLQATVLEVKAISGLGTTIDAILINGRLREGDTMILAGTDGPIVTQIRSLLMPQPLKELRVKNAYQEHKEVQAAQGVKIAAKDLEKAIAGINLLIAHKPDEVEICRYEVARELRHALSHIKLKERGVYVQASTLGSLEALLEFLRSSSIPYSAIRIGPVVKRDVMKASTMLEHESQFATILAFDVKVERDAQEMADSLGVKIFQADIIYHLFDKFMAYREELKQKKREEFKSIAVFPCKLKILPQFIFNSRDPIVMGVMIEAGIVKEGTPICVPSKEFVEIGIVTSIESNHKQVETARKGQEVCIKIEPIPGEAPKMFGRHFEASDILVSKITRQSIDACKDYFRDDLLKTDWALMVELKKLFQIL